jgi:DNA modification methylase|tara:strand:- start:4 stop:240 length:237 start_codon:yes stop_codon:yes gene_type:complete
MNDLINNLKKIADYHENITQVQIALDINNEYISSAMEKVEHTLANMKADIDIMNAEVKKFETELFENSNPDDGSWIGR